jgi:K+-sensing histidine kinase KdpD
MRERSVRLRTTRLDEAKLSSLEGVERRRLQLWMLAAVVIVVAAAGAVFGAVELDTDRFWWARDGALQKSLLALSIGFIFYAIEKELHLRRLTRALIEERALSAALTTRIGELTALMEAGRAMNAVLELDDVLRIILRNAIDLLGGQNGSVMMVQEDGTLEAVCTYGNDDAYGTRLAVGDGIAGRVALTREPVLLSGTATQGESGHADRDKPVESAMSVPLQHRDELLGVLNCNAAEGHRFTEYDLRAFALFAEHAAIAIANARLFEATQRHVDELLQLDEMKNEFISAVSHDLRTPLTSIMGSATVAMRSDLPDAARSELLGSIKRQADRLEAMVQQLLESAALNAARDDGVTETTDLAERARDLADERCRAGESVDVLAPRGCVVACSGAVLDRILGNLLDNAAKHGRPPVIVRVVASEGEVRCSVTDAGRGIEPEHRERVFERFYRVDRSRSSAGLGLGLSIVRTLAEAHDGRAWVETTAEGRTSFCFALPVVAEPSLAAG